MASRSWNRVELMGNLTRDPELRYTPSGAAVCTFGLATNRSYLVDGERKEEVDFHRLVSWNKLAELCSQLLKKGTRVFISGRLSYREWEGQDGQKRKDTEIVIEDMIVLTPKNENSFSGEAVDDLDFKRGESVVKQEVGSVSAEDNSVSQDGSASKKDDEDKKTSSKPSEDVAEDLPF